MKSKRSKYEHAVGLSYEGESELPPQVTVKGDGFQADEVVRLARRYGVPVVEKGEVSELLSGISLDETIPPDLFEAVALILSELKSFQDPRK